MRDSLIKSGEMLGLLIPPDSSVQHSLLGLRVQHPRGEKCSTAQPRVLSWMPGRNPGLGSDTLRSLGQSHASASLPVQ